MKKGTFENEVTLASWTLEVALVVNGTRTVSVPCKEESAADERKRTTAYLFVSDRWILGRSMADRLPSQSIGF
jgi:hypothetical protein